MANCCLVHGPDCWGALLPVTLFPAHRLEKEMESLEVAMAVEVQQLVNQKLPETTRMTMEENTQVKARFNQLSEEVVVLMSENTALRANKSQFSINVSTLEKMMSEVSRQNALRKKVSGKSLNVSPRLNRLLSFASFKINSQCFWIGYFLLHENNVNPSRC